MNNVNEVNVPSNLNGSEDLVLDIKEQVSQEEAIDKQIESITQMQNELAKKVAILEKQRVRKFLHKAVDFTADNSEKAAVLSVKGTKGAAYYFGVSLEWVGVVIVKVAVFTAWVSAKIKKFSGS